MELVRHQPMLKLELFWNVSLNATNLILLRQGYAQILSKSGIILLPPATNRHGRCHILDLCYSKNMHSSILYFVKISRSDNSRVNNLAKRALTSKSSQVWFEIAPKYVIFLVA